MTKANIYKMTETIFLYPGENTNWHFLPVTKKNGQEIRNKFPKQSRGFGSLRVEATIGKTTWQTSIFPDKYSGSYILPVKALVRRAEDIAAKDIVTYSMKLL